MTSRILHIIEARLGAKEAHLRHMHSNAINQAYESKEVHIHHLFSISGGNHAKNRIHDGANVINVPPK